MPRPILLLTLSMILLAASQLPVLATRWQPATINQATPAPNWQRVDTGQFSVALPPGWSYVPRQGTDSFVGELVGPDMSLLFDYGWYWNSRPANGASGYEVLHEDVDFRPAEIWVARADPAEVTALYVDYVKDPNPSLPPTRLSLLGQRLAPAQQDLALVIMRSLRFQRVIAEHGTWEVVAELPQTALVDLQLIGDGAPRVAGGYYVTGVIPPVGAVYDLRDGAWQRQVISDTGMIAGLDRDWAVDWGGQHLVHLDSDGVWRTTAPESPGILDDLQFVGSEAWAVGFNTLLHFDGSMWTSILGSGGGSSIDLVSKDEGWIGGGQKLVRRTAGAWQAEPWPGPDNVFMEALDTVSAREAWFAGGLDMRGAGKAGSMLHWRDGNWRYIADLSAHPLWGVDLVSPAEGWAVGGQIAGNEPCEVLRLDAGAWKPQSDGCIGHLHAVQVAADGTTWAVGYRRTVDGVFTGLVMRYAASAVTPTATDMPLPTTTATPTPAVTTTPPRTRLYVPLVQKKW